MSEARGYVITKARGRGLPHEGRSALAADAAREGRLYDRDDQFEAGSIGWRSFAVWQSEAAARKALWDMCRADGMGEDSDPAIYGSLSVEAAAEYVEYYVYPDQIVWMD